MVKVVKTMMHATVRFLRVIVVDTIGDEGCGFLEGEESVV